MMSHVRLSKYGVIQRGIPSLALADCMFIDHGHVEVIQDGLKEPIPLNKNNRVA